MMIFRLMVLLMASLLLTNTTYADYSPSPIIKQALNKPWMFTSNADKASSATNTAPSGQSHNEKFVCHSTDGIGLIACHMSEFIMSILPLIQSLSLVLGLGFFIGSIFKFKQHKDNPSQVPVGTPLAYAMVAIALIYSSNIVEIIGTSLFKDGKDGVKVIKDKESFESQLPKRSQG